MLGLAIITSASSCFLTIFLFFRYALFMPWGVPAKAAALVIALGIGFSPILLHHSMENFLGKFYVLHYHFIYCVFMTTVFLWCLTVVRDIVWLIVHCVVPKVPGLMSPITGKVNAITIVIAVLCALVALYEGMKVPPVKSITIPSAKIITEKKIVLMPDIHINRVISENKLNQLIEQANAQNPDLILLMGDIVDDIPGRIKGIVQNLKKLQAKSGVYAVAGNHESYIGYKQATRVLEENNIPVLANNGVSVADDLFLGGIPDTRSVRFSGLNYDINKTFQPAKPEQYKILMSHTPTHFDSAPFDLEVAGHTHGGQLPPFYPLIYFFQRYVAGLYDMDKNTQIYVSRGAGQWGPQMRLFAPSEMTVITLTPQ